MPDSGPTAAPPPMSDRPEGNKGPKPVFVPTDEMNRFLISLPTQTPTVGKLIPKLATAIPEIPGIVMTKTAVVQTTRRNYSYKYAGLIDVMEAIRPVFGKHGLLITHQPLIAGTAMFMITKVWFGEEWIAAPYPVIDNWNAQSQAVGSAYTYARRYSLMGLLGIVAEEDDDGQSAKADHEERTAPERSSASGQKTEAAEPPAKAETRRTTPKKPSNEEIDATVKRVRSQITEGGTGEVPTDGELNFCIRWYEREIGAQPNHAALKSFWDTNVAFARALYKANSHVGDWVKQVYDQALTKALQEAT